MTGCRPLDLAEVRAVLAAPSGPSARRDRALIAVGISTGYRISEVLAARVVDVRGPAEIRRVLRIARQNVKGRKKGQSAHLAPFARDALADWLAELELARPLAPSAPVFPSPRDPQRPLSRAQAWRIWRAACQSAGIEGPPGELGTHSMRKTFAAMMYEQFGDVFSVQRALRHSSPASTVAYLSFADDDLRVAVETAYGVLSGV